MKPRILVKAHCGFALMVLLCGCGDKATVDAAAEAPPGRVVEQQDVNLVEVEQPERLSLATAAPYNERPTLDVTGTVNPDVSRTVPVISLASGRVLDVRAKLGDHVHKGDLLMQIQSNDIATAFSDYEKANADEVLARVQLGRSKLLYDKGAIAQKELEVARDTEEKAKVDVAAPPTHPRFWRCRQSSFPDREYLRAGSGVLPTKCYSGLGRKDTRQFSQPVYDRGPLDCLGAV